MSKNFLLIILFLPFVLNAYTLKESILETLRTNPVVQERLKNFRATQQDINIAQSEYYPSLDLRVGGGYTKSGHLKNGNDDFDNSANDAEYLSYESSLTYTHNLFNGLSTYRKVEYEENRVFAAAHKYLEKVNDIAFQMTSAYIEVLKSDALVQTSIENVEINEDIYIKVNDLFKAGLTTDSEVKKIQSTLSLARSNLTVQRNNATDTWYKYRRILGRLPEIDKLQKPILDIKMPESIERAALYAIENNPSILVSRYNIKGAQALWKQKQAGYYPSVDLEVSQSFNDNDQVGNGYDQADDRFRARIIFSYNLFRGGYDQADTQKHISNLNQEVEIQRDLKRQVIEGLDLSWNAYKMIGKQLIDLREYSQFAEKTLELYKEEYDLGRRSLLDLLSAQSDVINSRSQIIQAEYDQLYAKYRILDAMGLLVVAVNGNADEFTAKVNLYSDDVEEVLDTVDIELDVDKDKIADSIDLCDNSLKDNNIMPYGCKKVVPDSDKDGVLDHIDECPNTKLGVIVKTNGCAPSKPKIKVKKVIEKSVALFDYDSAEIKEGFEEKMEEVIDYLQSNPDANVTVVGHTSQKRLSSERYNVDLSYRRAKKVKSELIKYRIDEQRISIDGKGFYEPVADNSTDEGRAKNRRTEITVVKPFQEKGLE